MTWIPIPAPTYLQANGTCTTDYEANVVALAPNRTGYWWGGYQAAIPNSGGGQITVRLQVDGINANVYSAAADESGGEAMYINHMGIHLWGGDIGVMGPGNALRAYANKAGHGNFEIYIFLVFIPTRAYPH